jgi:hypothetical protein
MNWRILPALKRLDHEPREELDVDSGAWLEVTGGEAVSRGHVGETGLIRPVFPPELDREILK